LQVLKNFKLPKQAGEYFRLLCMTGENKGHSYLLKEDRVVLGRSPDVDIEVKDMKSSREHAEIVKTSEGYNLTDLKSQNGIFVNGDKVNHKVLEEGDKIIIGRTVYKFSMIKVEERKNILEFPNKGGDDEEEEKTASGKKVIFLVLVIGIAILMLTSEGENPEAKKKRLAVNVKTNEVSDQFARQIQQKKMKEDKEISDELKVIFLNGFREAREGNYFRAIKQFELADQHAPGNSKTLFYLQKLRQQLDDKITALFLKAEREDEALQYDSSVKTVCSIQRLLQNFPDDERYKKAQNKIEQLEKKMGLDQGEVNCL